MSNSWSIDLFPVSPPASIRWTRSSINKFRSVPSCSLLSLHNGGSEERQLKVLMDTGITLDSNICSTSSMHQIPAFRSSCKINVMNQKRNFHFICLCSVILDLSIQNKQKRTSRLSHQDSCAGGGEDDVMSTVNVINYPQASAGLHYTLFK